MTEERKDQALATMEPAAGQIARQGFGSSELLTQAETAGGALAAREQASVQARYVMAMRNPRDWDDVRQRLLAECKRPGFGAVAWYKVKNKGEGFTIRFAEAAMRCMTNLLVETNITWDDAHKRILQVSVTDLESNVTIPSSVMVEKTVERRSAREGDTLGVRKNSYGDVVYIVRATEDELFAKQNSAVSKTVRNAALRILPGDLQDECKRIIQQRVVEDTAAARKKIADSFAELHVMPSALKEYLGHDLGTASPSELEELRGVYGAVKGGEMSWHEALAAKREGGEKGAEPEEPKGSTLDRAAEVIAGPGEKKPPSADPELSAELDRQAAESSGDDAFERGRREARKQKESR